MGDEWTNNAKFNIIIIGVVAGILAFLISKINLKFGLIVFALGFAVMFIYALYMRMIKPSREYRRGYEDESGRIEARRRSR